MCSMYSFMLHVHTHFENVKVYSEQCNKSSVLKTFCTKKYTFAKPFVITYYQGGYVFTCVLWCGWFVTRITQNLMYGFP